MRVLDGKSVFMFMIYTTNNIVPQEFQLTVTFMNMYRHQAVDPILSKTTPYMWSLFQKLHMFHHIMQDSLI